MKLRNLLMAAFAGAALLAGCSKEVELGPAKLEVNPTGISFEAAVDSREITLLATRDWAVSGLPDWLGLSMDSGDGNPEVQKLSITVLENKGYNRKANLIFSIGFDRVVIKVTQEGPDGELDNGDGTKSNPYNVTGILATLKELGADVNTGKVYITGKIASVTEQYKNDTYGSGTFIITDDGEISSPQFTVYRAYYLGGKKFGKDDTPVQKGDDVIIFGKTVLHKGTTPETVQNEAFLYSLNGVDKGGDDGGQVGPVEEGTVAHILSQIESTDQSSPSAFTTELKGAVVSYVNGNSAYIEDSSAAILIYLAGHGFKAGDKISGPLVGTGYIRYGVPQIVSLAEGFTKAEGGEIPLKEITLAALAADYGSNMSRRVIVKGVTVTDAIADGDQNGKIKQGDNEMAVYAQLKNSGLTLALDATGDLICFPAKYNTNQQLAFWDNADFSGSGDTPVTPPAEGDDISGEGTEASPYSVAAAVDAVKDLTWTDKDNYDKIGPFYVKGKISSVKFTFSAQYGTATFNISFDGSTTAKQFTCYGVKYLGNVAWTEGCDQIAVGDEVVVCGEFMNYGGNTPETVNGSGYIVSRTPAPSGGDTPGGDTPGGSDTLNPLESNVTFTGVTNAYTDNTINVTYGTSTVNSVKNIKLGKSTAYGEGTIGLPAGTTKITFFAIGWKNYPASVKFTISGAEYTQDIKANDGASGSGALNITVTDTDRYTITLPAALTAATDAKVETYAGTNSGQRAFIFGVHALTGESGDTPGGDTPGGDTPEEPQLPKHDGLTEANAFTVQDAIYVAKNSTEDKEYYVKAIVGKDIEIKGGSASFELLDGTTSEILTVYRTKSFKGADFTGQEPLGWLDEVVIKGKVSLLAGSLPAITSGTLVKWNGAATFLDPDTNLSFVTALPDNSEFYLEALVAATSTNGNSFVVTDGVNNFYIYKPAQGAAVGDKVRVMGTKTSYGGVVESKAGAEVEILSSGNAVTLGDATDITASFDAFPASTTQNQLVKFVGTLVKSGNYYNVEVAGATAYKGSVSYPVAALVTDLDALAALEDKTVSITGFYVGTSGSSSPKFLNVIATKAVKYVAAPAPVTLEFAAWDPALVNGTQYPSLSKGIVSLGFGDGANDGKYYNTGSGIRVYGGGHCTVSCTEANIKKIVFTYDASGAYAPTEASIANVGTYNVSTHTWTGDAASVTITRPTGSGQWRIQKIVVSFE